MIDLRSGCRRQINLVITPPTKEILIRGALRWAEIWGNRMVIRNSPYPPSFRRMAARIIDPAIGASTCAFGSHKWTVKRGSFTKNAAKMIIVIK